MGALQKIIRDLNERRERYIASRHPVEQAILRALIAEEDERNRQIEELVYNGDGSASEPEEVMRA